MAKHAAHAKQPEKNGKKLAIILASVALAFLVAAFAAFFLFAMATQYSPSSPVVSLQEKSASEEPGETFSESNVSDKEPSKEQIEKDVVKTAKIAYLKDMAIRSTVTPADMTAILFHQASYGDALVVKTKLKEADPGKAYKHHYVRVNNEQRDVSGWADADALHVWRMQDVTPMDTSIDVGAKPGTPVYAPVTGTVVLVKKYKLYDEMNDYQIHIQPDGHPEFDCVVLHSDKPVVKAKDRVKAGVTQIASMRKISGHLTGIQLADYTKEGGNHSHIQIGDANNAEYRRRTMKGAILTGKEKPEQLAAHEEAKKDPRPSKKDKQA